MAKSEGNARRMLLDQLLLIVILSRTKAASGVALSLPGCPDKCRNITIPYPFGMVEGRYLSIEYQVNSETLRVSNTRFKLLGTSLIDGYMRGSLPMGFHCYNKAHKVTSKSEPKINLSRFQVSTTENLLTTFHITHHENLQNRSFPVVLDWSIGYTSFEEAQKNISSYACKANSVCLDAMTESNQSYQGYRCQCAPGYQGNPYLPNVSQDIGGNTNGSYNCSCPLGQHGDSREGGNRCSDHTRTVGNSVYWGVGMGTAASFVLTFIIYWGLKQRQIMKNREIFFKKNGGLILQKVLFESKQSSSMAKLFAARDLEKATNKFHNTNIVGQGGYGTVYKGTLADKTIVAIKKAKSIDESQIEQFINEVIILSQISHPNVVKLLGCCLETQTPLLVYEFVTNKTIFHHLHEQGYISSMTFERRLNIATQTATALSHIYSTTQIVHRDIKSLNILLTDDYTAKVSDFGISRLIPINETHIQTLVHGTLGYIDPEYFRTGILTEKSDVYSFGMVLVELLTGRKVFSHDRTESDLGLATYFLFSLERGQLLQILDDEVKKDGLNEHIRYFSKLAKDCVELEGKKRPSMLEVKGELEELRESYLKSSIMPKKIIFFEMDDLVDYLIDKVGDTHAQGL